MARSGSTQRGTADEINGVQRTFGLILVEPCWLRYWARPGAFSQTISGTSQITIGFKADTIPQRSVLIGPYVVDAKGTWKDIPELDEFR